MHRVWGTTAFGVLDRDILSVPAEQICRLKVMYTLKDGALIYDREGGGYQC